MRRALLAAVVLVALAACLLWLRPLAGLRTAARARAFLGGAVERSARSDDGRLAWLEAGRGPVVVLVHGLRGEAAVWARVMGPLAARDLRVVALDLPGYGRSSPASVPATLDEEIAAVERLIDHVSPNAPVRLVGNSMGGWIAMRVALANPARVSRLVLSAPAGLDFEPPPLHVLVAGREEDMERNLSRVFHRPPALPGRAIEGLARRDPRVSLDLLGDARTGRLRVDDLAAALTMPTLIVWGADDGVIPLEVGRRLADRIEGSALTVIAETGHVPFLERPEAFVKAVAAFLTVPDEVATPVAEDRPASGGR